MEKLCTYSLDEIFEHMDNKRPLLYGSQKVRLRSARLVLFRTKGPDCVTCEAKGSYFSLERHTSDIKPHLNLYARNEKGEDVLMTKDHILPRSRGGADEQSNYQPMCTLCNGKKADKVSEQISA